MSHTLVETPTFDTPITVPDGLDPGSNRAADTAAIAQKLANRTRALKAVTDVAARTDNSVTFNGHVTALGDLRSLDHCTVGTDGNGNLTVNGIATIKDNATIGSDGSGTLTVNGASSLNGVVTGSADIIT